MELLGKPCILCQEPTLSAVLCSGKSCGCIIQSRFISPPQLSSSAKRLPRISKGILSTTSSAKVEANCGVAKWYGKNREQRLAGLQIEASSSIIAGRTTAAAARRSKPRNPKESGGVNVELELEILAFMLQSGKSDKFPTREELINTGRQDLVEAIVAEGGWLASGWGKKAKDSHARVDIQEVPRRPLIRQRAVRRKSKVVSSPRRPRGRPKLSQRSSLPISASQGENSKAKEPPEKVDDQSSSSPRLYDISDGNTPEENRTAVGRVEDQACGTLFKQVRKESGSIFPNSPTSRLWESESLAAFLEFRKFDARKESGQRRESKFNAASDLLKTATTCVSEGKFAVSAVEEGKKVDDAVTGKIDFTGQKDTEVDDAQAELKMASTDEISSTKTLASTYITFDRGLDQPTVSEIDMDVRITAMQRTAIGEASSPEPMLETPATVEKDRRVDHAVISRSGKTVLQYPENSEGLWDVAEMKKDDRRESHAEISGPEMYAAIAAEKQARIDEAVCHEALSDVQSGIEQDRLSEGHVVTGIETDIAAITERYRKLDETKHFDLVSETMAVVESSKELDKGADRAGVTIRQSEWVKETLHCEDELGNGLLTQEHRKLREANYPQAEMNTSPSTGAQEKFSVRSPGDIQASVTGVDSDPLSAGERNTGAGKASVVSNTLSQASTEGREVRDIIVESEDKAKKAKKKVLSEKREDVCKTADKPSETLDWIQQLVERREQEIREGNARSEGARDLPKSIQDRICSLENKLSASRTALQPRRVALEQKGHGQEPSSSPSNVHSRRLAELRKASDELEFMENKILKLSSELKTTRHEVAAFEGAQGIEIREVQNVVGENEKKLQQSIHSLRAARVVWPHPAREVFLIGSFNGWKEKIKMELSGAGVFVVSISLPPGRYEIKFVVDGTWRVDTERPIVYVGGYENNVLVIPEHFSINLKR